MSDCKEVESRILQLYSITVVGQSNWFSMDEIETFFWVWVLVRSGLSSRFLVWFYSLMDGTVSIPPNTWCILQMIGRGISRNPLLERKGMGTFGWFYGSSGLARTFIFLIFEVIKRVLNVEPEEVSPADFSSAKLKEKESQGISCVTHMEGCISIYIILRASLFVFIENDEIFRNGEFWNSRKGLKFENNFFDRFRDKQNSLSISK